MGPSAISHRGKQDPKREETSFSYTPSTLATVSFFGRISTTLRLSISARRVFLDGEREELSYHGGGTRIIYFIERSSSPHWTGNSWPRGGKFWTLLLSNLEEEDPLITRRIPFLSLWITSL